MTKEECAAKWLMSQAEWQAMSKPNENAMALREIAAAILEHTTATLELAQAIREHAYITTPEQEDEDAPPDTYMDGTPVQ